MTPGINGIKIILTGDEYLIAGARSNSEREKRSKNFPETTFSVSGVFPGVPDWEFYLRRKNTFWFRSITGRIKIEVDEIPPELKNLKYGQKVNLGFS